MMIRGAVPYSRLPWVRPLVEATTAHFDSVAALFAGNPASPESWAEVVRRVRGTHAGGRHRDIASLLARQLASRQAPEAARHAAARLADPGTVAVVTGQQAGVFGGPFYTLLKAISTILVARHVSATTAVPAVPVFWVDAEDHDWAEVHVAHLLDRDSSVVEVALGTLPGAGTQPVGRLVLDAGITETVERLLGALPPSEYSEWLRGALSTRYVPGARLTTAFAGLLDDVLGPHGLVVFEADDPAAKSLVSRAFAHELTHPGQTAELARRGAHRLTAAGHAPQIVPADDTVSLFYLDEGGRRPIRSRDGACAVGDESRTPDSLAAEAVAHPERFSPNVLLRPIVQDMLFPTVAYIAGPSELAYHAQLGDVYQAFGVERPLVVSRASATLLDSAAVKFLERQTVVPLEGLQPQDERALNRLLGSLLPPELDSACAELDALIQDRISRLKEVATAVDPTLAGAADTTGDRMRDTVKTLQAKIVQAAKKKDDTLRRQFSRTRALAFPAGHPQERLLNVAFFLNRYGPDLPARLLAALPALPDQHLVLVP